MSWLVFAVGLLVASPPTLCAGTWLDTFSGLSLSSPWSGDRDHFSIRDGALNGISASPLAPVPLRLVEVGNGWDNYVVQCRINVMTPNLLVCTKGALILRHSGNDGYVFALHVATQTIEVYRLSDNAMLLSKPQPLQLQRWYLVRAELQAGQMSFYVDDQLIGTISDQRSASGAVGLAVQDAMSVLFDDFSVTGPGNPDNGLRLSSANGKITITWPTNSALQSTDGFGYPFQWTMITNTPVLSGNQNVILLAPNSGNRFYRLNP